MVICTLDVVSSEELVKIFRAFSFLRFLRIGFHKVALINNAFVYGYGFNFFLGFRFGFVFRFDYGFDFGYGYGYGFVLFDYVGLYGGSFEDCLLYGRRAAYTLYDSHF